MYVPFFICDRNRNGQNLNVFEKIHWCSTVRNYSPGLFNELIRKFSAYTQVLLFYFKVDPDLFVC